MFTVSYRCQRLIFPLVSFLFWSIILPLGFPRDSLNRV